MCQTSQNAFVLAAALCVGKRLSTPFDCAVKVSFEEPVVQLSRFLLKLFRFRSLCRGLCWVWQRSGSAYARRSWINFQVKWATCMGSRSLQNDHLCASGLHSLPPTCSLVLRSRKPRNTIAKGVANKQARRCGSQICSPVKSRLYL